MYNIVLQLIGLYLLMQNAKSNFFAIELSVELYSQMKCTLINTFSMNNGVAALRTSRHTVTQGDGHTHG